MHFRRRQIWNNNMNITISDSMIRMYDSTTSRYTLINEIMAKDVSWCMLDIAFSPDGRNYAYSTWSSCSESPHASVHRVMAERTQCIMFVPFQSISVQ